MSQYTSFSQFFAFYLTEHRHPVSRTLHFIGTWGAFLCVVMLVVTRMPYWLLLGLLSGYSFAWVGHFFFEKNRPATFTHPLYSLIGDFAMARDILAGRIRW